MIRNLSKAALIALALACGQSAQAGVYSDDLGKCLVKSSSTDDQIVLVQWIFSAMTQHPAVQSMSNLTTEEQQGHNKKAAALMQRLMIVDCRKEAVAALKYEGSSSVETAFSLLGEVAMRGLMSDPHVQKSMESIGQALDEDAFKKLGEEAGAAK